MVSQMSYRKTSFYGKKKNEKIKKISIGYEFKVWSDALEMNQCKYNYLYRVLFLFIYQSPS